MVRDFSFGVTVCNFEDAHVDIGGLDVTSGDHSAEVVLPEVNDVLHSGEGLIDFEAAESAFGGLGGCEEWSAVVEVTAAHLREHCAEVEIGFERAGLPVFSTRNKGCVLFVGITVFSLVLADVGLIGALFLVAKTRVLLAHLFAVDIAAHLDEARDRAGPTCEGVVLILAIEDHEQFGDVLVAEMGVIVAETFNIGEKKSTAALEVVSGLWLIVGIVHRAIFLDVGAIGEGVLSVGFIECSAVRIGGHGSILLAAVGVGLLASCEV